jgi:glycyl-tRNA synthetase beta chain
MYWRKRGEVFVRPVRWLVAMLDEQVVPLELFGIAAGKTSRGHRIIGGRRAAVPLPSPSPAPMSKRCAARRFWARPSASR